MIKLLIDSGSDFTMNELYRNHVDFLPFDVIIKDKTYKADLLWSEISNNYMHDCLLNNGVVRINQPPVMLWVNQLEEYLKQGYDLLYLSISKEVSGGYKSFYMARNLLKSKYNNRMEVIDSTTASAGTKLLAYCIIDMINDGKSMDEIINEVEMLKSKVKFYSYSKSLSCWVNSGRIDTMQKEVPPGNPIMYGNNGVFSLDKLFQDREEGLDYLLSKLPSNTHMSGLTYSMDVSQTELVKVRNKLNNIKFDNLIGPTIFAVGGLETICISYIE